MTKKPELTFAAFIAASFLVCGLGAVIADSDTRTAAPAPPAAAQDSDLRRGARQTPDASLFAPSVAAAEITGPRRGARIVTQAVPTSRADAQTALADTVFRARREG